jgi:hypothetical protein
MSGWLPTIIYPSTVANAQTQLLASANGTNDTLCTGLSTGLTTGWNSFYAALSAFCKEDPGYFGLGTMMDQLESYQTNLKAWQQSIAKACPATAPAINPNNEINASTPALLSLGQWGLYAIIAVAGAYVVGEVVSAVVPVERAALPAKHVKGAAKEARRLVMR